MRLLILAQAVDRKDPALGFFVSWLKEFAKHFEHIDVIALRKGDEPLPSSVSVYSLGKEVRPSSKFFYTIRFWRNIWKLRGDYDAVLVHMNQEYVLLGGVIWKLLGKKIFMWRNHYSGSVLTDIAAMFCDKVFCTSKYSYTAKYKKTVLMPVGINLAPTQTPTDIKRLPRSILFLARLDESKRPALLISALGKLAKESAGYLATFVGAPSNPASPYPAQLEDQIRKLNLIGQIHFVGAIENAETPRYYRSHEIFVNTSKSGMLDKTIFEAAVGGALVLSSSKDIAESMDQKFIYKDGDAEDLAEKIKGLLSMTDEEKSKAREEFAQLAEENSLEKLGNKLAEEIQH